ncbi:hypothetical protein BC826DRAFT_972260 [Russula brevipes]|nr:hypothetical protein BC826DRAFT_972260 [Russula brevipes]
MTVVQNSAPSGDYAVNVRCVQVIQETAQRRIMLAQLVTDEAKPGSGEKWSVSRFLFPSFSKVPDGFFGGSILGSALTRSYFFTPAGELNIDKLSALGIDMDDGTIADVDRSSVQGTLTDVIVSVLTSKGWNHQTEVVELVNTALASLGNSKNQPAIDAFKGAAVQDVAGATATFEVDRVAGFYQIAYRYHFFQVQTLSADDSGDLRIRGNRINLIRLGSCWFSLVIQLGDPHLGAASQVTATRETFSLKTASEQFSIQYRAHMIHVQVWESISSGILERDFADRTTRVIVEKAAPFYAVRGVSMLAPLPEGLNAQVEQRNVRKVNE